MPNATILLGDARTRLAEIPEQSVQCCITSPPYWGLRDYGKEEQIGLEQSPSEYVSELVNVFDEVWRVLKDDGVLWVNLGDSYARAGGWSNNSGLDGVSRLEGKRAKTNMTGIGATSQKLAKGFKTKDLIGIPFRVAFALQEAGWYLRQDIIWSKPNPMPESVTDRCVKAHEYLFLLSKNKNYYFDYAALQEDATGEGKRNKRDVWTIPVKPFKGAHFAVMPEALVEPCVLAATQQGDTILDPFTGSGTVAVVALAHNRNFIGTELNHEYANIAEQRISDANPMFNTVTINH